MNKVRLTGIFLLAVILLGSALPISQAAPKVQRVIGPAELAVWDTETGNLTILNPGTTQVRKVHFGQKGDKPVPGYYYGPADEGYEMVFAVWRPSDGMWYISHDNPLAKDGELAVDEAMSVQLGDPDDKPVPADYDGDGKTDPAVWDEMTGIWKILLGGTIVEAQCGEGLDVPIPGDYDGDGKDEIAVYRYHSNEVYISLDNVNWGSGPTLTMSPLNVGHQKLVSGVFDVDSADDIAMWNQDLGVFTLLAIVGMDVDNLVLNTFQTGESGDIPVVADFDGDGGDDFAVWRPLAGYFYINYSRQDWATAPADQLASYFLGIDAGSVPVPGQYWIDEVG